jgi:Ca2+-binding RTX toxin-like protein
MATFNGDSRNNLYSGTSAADAIHGNVGNDTLIGMGGDDTINGGEGNDWLEGGTGNDELTGGEGSDTLIGGAGSDWFTASSGDNLFALVGGAGFRAQTIGGPGFDTLILNFRSVGGGRTNKRDLSFQAHGADGDTFGVYDANSNLIVDASNIDALDFTGTRYDESIDLGTVTGSVDGGGGLNTLSFDQSARTAALTLTTSGLTEASPGSMPTQLLSITAIGDLLTALQ